MSMFATSASNVGQEAATSENFSKCGWVALVVLSVGARVNWIVCNQSLCLERSCRDKVVVL